MRIALFCHKYWPAVGGLCTYTGRLVEYLIGRGHEVRVFTTNSPPAAPSREQVAPRLLIRRFPTAFGSHPPYYFMPRLATMIGSHELRSVELVHTVGYYFFPTVFAHAMAGGRIPHISTPVYTLNPSTWQRRTFDAVMGRRLVRKAAHVIPQSSHELKLLHENRFTMRATTIVPFGVDSVLFEEEYDVEDLRQRHRIDGGERVLLFIGKIMSPKGAFDSLDAVARLRAQGRRLRLVMIGDVHERERGTFAARLRNLALTDTVLLLGPLTDRREISRYYQLSDVVLFPSQYEQFGIVAVEAAASGRPLIGTPVGIMQTLVPQYEYGLLHRFGDIDQFVRNLAEVLDEPRYRENAARHRREVLTQYDWRAIAAKTEQIYERALEERR